MFSITACLVLTATSLCPARAEVPETVYFDNTNDGTRLVAYLYIPATPGPHPAIVALHGRSGVYSSKAKTYDANFISARHKMWGEFWMQRGYLVLFVDTFGPRGYPAGFAAGTAKQRPREINEIDVRPLDAYAGLKYLRSRPDVIQDRIFLQGWSNGGSAALSAMAVSAPGLPYGERGFRAALVVYPGCAKVSSRYGTQYKTYAPLLLLIGTRDEEVRPDKCVILEKTAKENGSEFELVMYNGATHSYDSPVPRRQRVAANAAASDDTKRRAELFFRLFR